MKISPTRSRYLVSGGLTALLAALECALEADSETVIHPQELAVKVGAATVFIRWRRWRKTFALLEVLRPKS